VFFNRDNLINDIYLQSQMDTDNYVLISLIANFKLVKRLTDDLQLVIDILKGNVQTRLIRLNLSKSRSTD
jgi:hypothetical protein